jgi:hypothetical protein
LCVFCFAQAKRARIASGILPIQDSRARTLASHRTRLGGNCEARFFYQRVIVKNCCRDSFRAIAKNSKKLRDAGGRDLIGSAVFDRWAKVTDLSGRVKEKSLHGEIIFAATCA